MPHFFIKSYRLSKINLSTVFSNINFDTFCYKGIKYEVKNLWSSSHHLIEVAVNGEFNKNIIFIDCKNQKDGCLFKLYKTSKPAIDDGIKQFMLFLAHSIKNRLGGVEIYSDNISSNGKYPPLIDLTYEITGAVPEFLNWEEQFGGKHDKIVEIGFGRGDFLLKLGKFYPEADLIGIETQQRSVYMTKLKLKKVNAGHVKLIKFDAEAVLCHLFKSSSVAGLFINFPVPWPKKRQANKRLISASFARLAYDRLKIGGTLNLSTDSLNYFNMAKYNLLNAGFEVCVTNGIYKTETIGTKYESKWMAKGREIFICSFTKNRSMDYNVDEKTEGKLKVKRKDVYTNSAGDEMAVVDFVDNNLSERVFVADKLLSVGTFIVTPALDSVGNLGPHGIYADNDS